MVYNVFIEAHGEWWREAPTLVEQHWRETHKMAQEESLF